MFKIGDLIKGINTRYDYTDIDMKIGKVECVWICPTTKRKYMDIRIIEHSNSNWNRYLFPALNEQEYFELIK